MNPLPRDVNEKMIALLTRIARKQGQVEWDDQSRHYDLDTSHSPVEPRPETNY